MAKRHEDALWAQAGACNALALSIVLTSAFRDVRAEAHHASDTERWHDPAAQLILHQLCHLAGITTIDSNRPDADLDFDYDRARIACINQADETILQTLRLAHQRTCMPDGTPTAEALMRARETGP